MQTTAALRTDDDFLNMRAVPGGDDHIRSRSVAIDAMHQNDFGIGKKLVDFICTKRKFLRAPQRKIINDRLIAIASTQPSEIKRKMRSMEDRALWKAVEYRNFILYAGISALKGVLPDVNYNHFLYLSLAIRILSNNNFTCLSEEADVLLIAFVNDYAKLYGKRHLSSKVHSLIHLGSQVRLHGAPPYDFSAYKFESFMGEIRSMLHKHSYPLEQIVKRTYESANAQALFPETKSGLKVYREKDFVRKVVIKDTIIDYSTNNSWFLDVKGDVCRVIAIEVHANDVLLRVKKLRELRDLFDETIKSNLLNMFLSNASDFAEGTFDISFTKDIKCKMFTAPFLNETSFIAMSDIDA